jgi:hypothetical protein
LIPECLAEARSTQNFFELVSSCWEIFNMLDWKYASYCKGFSITYKPLCCILHNLTKFKWVRVNNNSWQLFFNNFSNPTGNPRSWRTVGFGEIKDACLPSKIQSNDGNTQRVRRGQIQPKLWSHP